jgi:ribosomal protein L16/L10AE
MHKCSLFFSSFEISPIANEEDGKIVLLVVLLVKKVRQIYFGLEPIREVWIHDEAVAASRLSMMRIMARRMNAVAVVA